MIEYKTHYEPVETAREKPGEYSDLYQLLKDLVDAMAGDVYSWNGKAFVNISREATWVAKDYILDNKEWFQPISLKPRPDTVLMTREEVERMVRDAFGSGQNFQADNNGHFVGRETYINNLFK